MAKVRRHLKIVNQRVPKLDEIAPRRAALPPLGDLPGSKACSTVNNSLDALSDCAGLKLGKDKIGEIVEKAASAIRAVA